MTKNNWIILVDHTSASAYIISDFKKNNFKVLYLGTNRELQKLSDDFIDENPTQDPAGFLEKHNEKLKRTQAVGVYSLLEHAKTAENIISEGLGIPTTSSKVLSLSRDKYLMRKVLLETELSGPKIHFIEDDSEVEEPKLPFPFIVKPNSGFASGGVQLVRNLDEYFSAIKVVRRLNRFVLSKCGVLRTGALCEEYIRGPEYSVDALTVEGKTKVFCVCGRGFVSEENYQDYLYFTSPPLPDGETTENISQLISKFLSTIGHTDGPSHTEIRYDLQKKRWIVIESGLRVGFAGNIGRLIQETSEVPYNILALKAHLKFLTYDELRSHLKTPTRYGFVFTPATGKGGIIRTINGQDFVLSDDRIKYYNFQKQIGDAVVPYPKGLEYLGVIIGAADSLEEQQDLASMTARKVEFIYD